MNIVSLEQRRAEQRAHRKLLRDAEHRLHEIEDELFDLAVQVAISGPLRTWADEQPIGAVTNMFELLAGVQDGHVVALLQLREAIATAVEHLQGPA